MGNKKSKKDSKYIKGDKVDVIKERLGKGTFGKVFLAYVRRNALVVKRLEYMEDGNDDKKQKILKERDLNILIQTKFDSHPNIVKYYDYTIPESDPPAYDLLFEYCNKKDFYNYYDSGETIVMKDFCKQFLTGLDVIHRLGWVHQDIKPENIMVNVDAQNKVEYKIGDFGEAIKQNTIGRLRGTVEYMSVDQILTDNPKRYSIDVFSFGNVLCWLFTNLSLNEHFCGDDKYKDLFYGNENNTESYVRHVKAKFRRNVYINMPKKTEPMMQKKVEEILSRKPSKWIDFVKSMFTRERDGPTAKELLQKLSRLDDIVQRDVMTDGAEMNRLRHDALRPVDVLQLKTKKFRF